MHRVQFLGGLGTLKKNAILSLRIFFFNVPKSIIYNTGTLEGATTACVPLPTPI